MPPFINSPIWDTPDSPPTLNSNEIHVWRLSLAEPPGYGVEQLQTLELQRYAKIYNPVQASRFLSSRIQLRTILAGYCGIESDAIDIQQSTLGKPFLVPATHGIMFNLTHTGDSGLLAVAQDFDLGIDIEAIRELQHKSAISRRVFSPEIQSLLEKSVGEYKNQTFFEQWTRMEAVQKTFGKGIFSEKIDHNAAGMWSFQPETGFVATLAWSEPTLTPTIRLFNYIQR